MDRKNSKSSSHTMSKNLKKRCEMGKERGEEKDEKGKGILLLRNEFGKKLSEVKRERKLIVLDFLCDENRE